MKRAVIVDTQGDQKGEKDYSGGQIRGGAARGVFGAVGGWVGGRIRGGSFMFPHWG